MRPRLDGELFENQVEKTLRDEGRVTIFLARKVYASCFFSFLLSFRLSRLQAQVTCKGLTISHAEFLGISSGARGCCPPGRTNHVRAGQGPLRSTLDCL